MQAASYIYTRTVFIILFFIYVSIYLSGNFLYYFEPKHAKALKQTPVLGAIYLKSEFTPVLYTTLGLHHWNS